MKKLIKKITVFILSVTLLSGCAGLSVDFSEGEGFFDEKSEYTVIDPKKHSDDPANKETTFGEKTEYDSKEEEFHEENEETASEDVIQKSENIFIIGEEEESETEVLSSDERETSSSDGETASETSTENITESNETESIATYEIYSRTADVSRQIREKVDSMSKEEKAAELILARCPQSGAAELMAKYGFGGYTLYASDFKDKSFSEARDFISEIKNSADITPFIAVDEEGGDIVRVSKYPSFRETPFRSLREIYKESGIDGIISDSKEKAELLISLGINMNLAPVCDIAGEGDYIYERTVGASAYETGEAVKAIVDTSGEYGLTSCLKHFPGYGSNVDTHTGTAYDSRSRDSFENNDFIPFKSGISGKYMPAVLVNHNIVECMDSKFPASLSYEVHRVLREEIGFEGVIITDDLGMDGIKAYTGEISPYVMGIMSGNDLLCVSEPEKAFNDLISAINDGTLPMSTVDEHVKRILQMKRDYDII